MREAWLREYRDSMLSVFGSRAVFIGIQGSVARGEATLESDIDVVMILDSFSYEDLKLYDRAISELCDRDKICGFVSGMNELLLWDGADLFQFYNDTLSLYGSLDFIKDKITDNDAIRLMHRGACDIYHMCVHNALHEKSPEILKGLYKTAVIVLKAKLCVETGVYIREKKRLAEILSGDDRRILECEGDFSEDFDRMSGALMSWSSNIIKHVKIL